MSAKGEIGWKLRDADGNRREVYARRTGGRWFFYERTQRFERWRSVERPTLDDWLRLLDAIDRRINRRLLPPEAETEARNCIRQFYPGALKNAQRRPT